VATSLPVEVHSRKMRETERIADQLRRSFHGKSWHGPSVREVLAGVSAEQAATRVIPQAHTIWQIVLHITAWKSIVRARFLGEPGKKISPEEDWPPVGEASEQAWASALEMLEQAHRRLEEVIANFTDEKLDEPVAAGSPTAYILLHGIIQHDLYHAGQIALLKKQAGAA